MLYADEFDRAAELEEAERQAARFRPRPVMAPTGRCQDKACGAPLSDPQALFCDTECRAGFEREASARLRAGRR